MSYDAHVTRAEFWATNEGAWIQPADWLAVIMQDPELLLVSDSEPYAAEWQAGDTETIFEWDAGNVFVKSPTQAALVKMYQFAKKLSAIVQGDDGEIYRAGELLSEG